MDEETALIESNTRNEKIKKFFLKNKTAIISSVSLIILGVILLIIYGEYKNRNKIEISDRYNSTIINFKLDNKSQTFDELTKIIEEKSPTYSPLALYFIIDNELYSSKQNVNSYFDIIINKTPLENEIKNLVIYKKALFNADEINENELLDILKPIINSESVWKSHSLYLVAEYFFSKNEKQKAKEFFDQINLLPNSNSEIKSLTQKRLSRDFGDK